MKTRQIVAAALVAGGAFVAALPAQAADVGVSIQISEPGIYGRIDLGRFPQPQVVVAQPVIVVPPRVRPPRPVEPVYMWVPPGHRKSWSRYCGQYGACGVPVVFVRDDWYEGHVRPHQYQDDHRGGKGHDKGRGNGHGKDKGHGKGGRYD